MAIIFVSPKKKQRVFFVIITMVLVVFLAGISAIVFLPELLHQTENIAPAVSFHKPDVIINLNIVTSLQVKNLEPFGNVETTFTYTVLNKNGKQITGTIFAADVQSAQGLLEQSGFKVVSIQQMPVGRSDPFISY